MKGIMAKTFIIASSKKSMAGISCSHAFGHSAAAGKFIKKRKDFK